MERVLVLVALALLKVASAETHQEKLPTLDDFFFNRYFSHIHQLQRHQLGIFRQMWEINEKSLLGPSSWVSTTLLPMSREVFRYTETLITSIENEFAFDLENVTAHFVYEDLNARCSEHLETAIVDLLQELENTTCVMLRLRDLLTQKLHEAIKVGLQRSPCESLDTKLLLCRLVDRNCSRDYERRVGDAISLYVTRVNDAEPLFGDSPQDFIDFYVFKYKEWLSEPSIATFKFLTKMSFFTSTKQSIEPFSLQNVVRPWTNRAIATAFFNTVNNTKSRDELTWGVITSKTGAAVNPCSSSASVSLDSNYRCRFASSIQANSQLLSCAYKDATSRPLAWSTRTSSYFHSQCLCIVANGDDCGVAAPRGVHPQFHCLSVLLRDLQRRVWYRPAVTYLDYAFQTRVPLCSIANFLEVAFKRHCEEFEKTRNLGSILASQCYFQDLVDKRLNCSQILPVNDGLNHSQLCNLQFFMQSLSCDDAVVVHVPYYGAGRSTPVRVLMYVDVAVRILTLTTYLACPQLRNLPGKLLIGYQGTALLRLLVVRASLSLADLALAVRLDVATDLASTLWLTAYLHFLTESIEALRLPDSLSVAEARQVLLRYALLGWALPAVASAAFFCMDEFLDSRVQCGQLLFVLVNYAALLGNLYMFHHNYRFYYDVRSKAQPLRKDKKARGVFADMFNFALKTSLLSGAGIVFRLVFTQIQGLEYLLSYYHALGTLQGLLLFLLYGCNREARSFWRRVLTTTLRRLPNTSTS